MNVFLFSWEEEGYEENTIKLGENERLYEQRTPVSEAPT